MGLAALSAAFYEEVVRRLAAPLISADVFSERLSLISSFITFLKVDQFS